MKVSNALKEVWEWKDAVYEETKNLRGKELVRYIHKKVDRFLKEMGYRKVELSKGVYRLMLK